jgi:voltage-gated potassium channel Kch
MDPKPGTDRRPRRITDLSWQERRRAVGAAAGRSVVVAAVVLTVYYLLPAGGLPADAGAVLRLLGGGALFVAMMVWQVRRVRLASVPHVQAVEALVITVPVFLCTYAGAYFFTSQAQPESFTEVLDRTSALYFSVVTLGTVGYGDIAASTDFARILVSSQVMLDLALIAVVVRLMMTAAQVTVERGHRPRKRRPHS